MREDKVASTGVKTFRVAKIFADGMIRKMAGARENALFDNPRIRADFEHIQIVIGFEQQTISVAQMNFHKLGHVAEVGDERHLRAVGAEGEADGVGGVMRNLKCVDIYIANREVLAGLNSFECVEALAERVRKRAAKGVHRRLRDVKRRFPETEHLRKTIAVVGVLVSDEDTVDAVDA